MRDKSLYTIFVIFLVINLQAQWIQTTTDSAWQKRSLPKLKANIEVEENVVNIHLDKKLQVINGFGGSFNERGWDALAVLPAEKRQKILRNLFDDEQGCAFNICRMPLGANDYSMDYYSLAPVKNDYKMEHFTIEREKKYLMPYIKSAMQFNSDLKVWASPWCPPQWMKKSGIYACQGWKETSSMRWESEVLDAYALYFSKFIKAYREAGINLYAIHVQNEVAACQIFPSCLWSGEELSEFISDYLGPKLEQDGLGNTEIWLGTINHKDYSKYAGKVLNDADAAKYIDGVGYQWAGKFAVEETRENHPEIKIMQTESECGDGSNDQDAAEYTYSLICHYLKNGANSYLYWNMVLDNSGLSTWGWQQNSMISIGRYTMDVHYNQEFYVMKHLSHYIEPGARFIKTTGNDDDILVFENPDQEVIIIAGNDTQFPKTYTFKFNNKNLQVEIEPHSFNSFIINK